MAVELTLGHYLNMGGGVVISLLGLFVVSKTRGVRGMNLFGWFLVAFGLIFVFANLDEGTSEDDPKKQAFSIALVSISFGAATLLAVATPRMTGMPVPRRHLALAWLIASPLLVSLVGAFAFPWPLNANPVGAAAWMMSFVAALTVWAFAHTEEARRVGHSRRWAALTAGLGLYAFAQVGEILILGQTDPRIALIAIPAAVSMTAVVGLWLARTRGAGSRNARNVSLLLLLALLVGMVLEATGHSRGFNGIARVLGVGIIVHAILRDRLLGIDAKVRFALSKSTVAAVFIAVFFIASEVAQQFFGDQLGGAYVGIAAAGMLVFAIAPLQRAAERLAAKAVPVAAPAGTSSVNDSREADFREAVRLALRDRTLSRDEERHLIRIAHHMGIEPGRAMEIQDDVERTVKQAGR